MKKLLFTICLLTSFVSFSQSGWGFGVKGGLNFNSNGEISDAYGIQNINSDSNIGFHVGGFAKVDIIGLVYFRPELVFTKTTSKYENSTYNGKFDMSKLDAPLLVGLRIFGPIHIFAGPSLQYILNTDLENIELEDVENNFTVGLNMGVGVNIGEKLGVDLRYERGFSDNEAKFTGLEAGKIDTRPSQLILSLSVKL